MTDDGKFQYVDPFIGPGYLPADMFEFVANVRPAPSSLTPPDIRDGWALVSSGVTSDGKVIAVWARRKK